MVEISEGEIHTAAASRRRQRQDAVGWDPTVKSCRLGSRLVGVRKHDTVMAMNTPNPALQSGVKQKNVKEMDQTLTTHLLNCWQRNLLQNLSVQYYTSLCKTHEIPPKKKQKKTSNHLACWFT